jgi:hypothetical protein
MLSRGLGKKKDKETKKRGKGGARKTLTRKKRVRFLPSL